MAMRPAVPYAIYLAEDDILYIRLQESPIERCREIDIWRNVDYAADGSVVAVEFVNASASFRLDGVPEAERVASLITAAGISLPGAAVEERP